MNSTHFNTTVENNWNDDETQVRDPRVTFEKASDFLDLMEDYYAQPTEVKMKDVHPEWSYQVGD